MTDKEKIFNHIENITDEYLFKLLETNILFEDNNFLDDKWVQSFIFSTNKYLRNKISLLKSNLKIKDKDKDEDRKQDEKKKKLKTKTQKEKIINSEEKNSQSINIPHKKKNTQNHKKVNENIKSLEKKKSKKEKSEVSNLEKTPKPKKIKSKKKNKLELFREKILNNNQFDKYFSLFNEIYNFFHFRNKLYHSKITVVDFDKRVLNKKTFDEIRKKFEKLLENDENFQKSKQKLIELHLWNTKSSGHKILYSESYTINYLINNLNQDPIEVYIAYDWFEKSSKKSNFSKLWSKIKEYKKKLIWFDENSVMDEDKFRIIFVKDKNKFYIRIFRKNKSWVSYIWDKQQINDDENDNDI